MENTTIVKKEDILQSLCQLGVTNGDVLLVHSSLRSFGYVEGGVKTVAEALLCAVGEDGTLCVPTLVQQDFQNAYKTWYLDKPSDVGALTEFVRKMPSAQRSNQATHSLAAVGKQAKEITKEHTEYGRREGVFGDTPFSHASPWQKLYDLNAKVLFIGVDLRKLTLKHLLEYMIVEVALQAAGDKKEVTKRLKVFENRTADDPTLVWPWVDGMRMERIGQAENIIRYTDCGDAQLMIFGAADLMHRTIKDIANNPEVWFPENIVNWLYAAFGDAAALKHVLLRLIP
ncbi:MAG: AAC(3) family N-acetyltransferase [Clostridia bacterium]|nr:AAC(3) family N-acetyltransferase [Clostridia bacterium]